jgi:hypothetical protein
MRRVRRALMALALVACGGGGAGAPPDAAAFDGARMAADAAEIGDAPPASAAAAEFIAAYCARATSCCALAQLGTPASCPAHLMAAAGTFRASAAAACLGALASGCQGFDAQSCDRAFTTVTASKHRGDACASDEECLLATDGTVRCAAGHCQLTVSGKAGDTPCAGTASGSVVIPAAELPSTPTAYLCHIEDGVFCGPETRACTATRALGAACATFGECGAGRYCDDASGKCVARLAEGAPCTVDEQCPSTVCAETNVCAPPVSPRLAPLCGH